ncbi:AAA family ATPase [Stenotrophomonas sp.]|uniref:AAA family ATPase n=1 Tax=Stenotrophomonas sp. TaxID=69392 RepID=UPI0028AEF2A2|nr:AAA family ATPase [Stenotrophomonas sp.]
MSNSNDTRLASTPHPLLIPDGYQINTKPTERLANFVRRNIFEGHHGCSAYGGGGVGKTTAIAYLTDNASRWLIDADKRPMGVAMRMVMASGIRRTDRAFWSTMNDRMGIGTSGRISSADGMAKLRNLIGSRCGQAGVNRMVLFIDNAQRITEAEYEYLEDLDSMVLEDRLSLFLVLVRQSDAEGIDVGDDWRDRASHSIRRWFMATAPFGPLMGLDEVRHALGAYDSSWWPTPDMPFSRYFAKEAFDKGWRLSAEAPLIWEVASEMRKKGKLPESASWPMATFTLMVRHLLHEIAFRQSEFNGFTPAQVATALQNCGYLRLEYVRARMRMPSGN